VLEEALNYVRKGHVRKGNNLVVWRLDRLGRSLPHMIATMTDLEERGIGFKSLTENIDTTSGGKLIFHIFVPDKPFLNSVKVKRGLLKLLQS
jgi:DNA invertase Pin-like site-specific DNA recombinase